MSPGIPEPSAPLAPQQAPMFGAVETHVVNAPNAPVNVNALPPPSSPSPLNFASAPPAPNQQAQAQQHPPPTVPRPATNSSLNSNRRRPPSSAAAAATNRRPPPSASSGPPPLPMGGIPVVQQPPLPQAKRARLLPEGQLFTDVYSGDTTPSTREVLPTRSRDGLVEVRGVNSRDCVLQDRATQSHATIDIQTLIMGEQVKRSPFELTVCLDTSGSMSGRPIETAKDTIVEMLDQMSEGDLINLVTYSNTSVVKFKDVGPDRREWAKNEVAKVRAGGGTNIERGLKEAIGLFQQSEAPENAQRAIFLLSDGHPNGGLTSAASLAGVAATACRSRARLTSIGIGSDYNEDLLRDICDAGEGDFLHVKGAENIAECIAAAFQGLTTSLGTDAILYLESTEHGGATKAENFTLTQLRQGMPIGILRQDNLRQVVLHLESKAQGKVGEEVDLCRFRFQYRSGVTEEVEVVSGAIQAIVTEDESDLKALQMDVVVAYRLIELGKASEVVKGYVDRDNRDEARCVQDKCIQMLEGIQQHDRSRRGKASEMVRSMRETRAQMERPSWDRQQISKKSAYVQRCNKQQEEWMYSLA